jgi:hypothetical protein
VITGGVVSTWVVLVDVGFWDRAGGGLVPKAETRGVRLEAGGLGLEVGRSGKGRSFLSHFVVNRIFGDKIRARLET